MTVQAEKQPKLRALPSITDELRKLGLMHAYEDTPAGTRKQRPEPSVAAQLFAQGGYGVIVLPPEIWSIDTRAMVRFVTGLADRPRIPRSKIEAAIYGVLGELADRNQSVTAEVLALGILMAGAEAQGIPLTTPARDLAKEAGVRYQTLLTVRRIALVQLGEWEVYNHRFRNFREAMDQFGWDAEPDD